MNKKQAHVIFDRTEMEIKIKRTWQSFPYESVIGVRAESHYVEILISTLKTPVYVNVPLKIFEKNLPVIFFKYSRSGIINLGYMKSRTVKGNSIEIKTEDESYTVSRSMKTSFNYIMELLNRRSLPCEQCKICTKRGTCSDMIPFTMQNTE